MTGEWEALVQRAITPHVTGRAVADLGCGSDFAHAERLLRADAKFVMGVDKERRRSEHLFPKTMYIEANFGWLGSMLNLDGWVAYVSWPDGTCYGLEQLLATTFQRTTVIYRGKNTDGTSCGSPPFWRHLQTREVRDVLISRRETLIVYGWASGRPTPQREALPEERFGLDTVNVHSFAELQAETVKQRPELAGHGDE